MRGAIRLFEPATPAPAETSEPLVLPAAGVTALVAVRKLNVDEWEAAADRVLAEPARGSSPAPGLDTGAAQATFRTRSACALGELTIGLATPRQRRRRPVAGWRPLARQRRRGPARAATSSTASRAAARRGGPGAGRVYARLSRLNLPKGEAERVESLLDEPPASVPALDIVVDDFELRGKRLGRLEIEAANRRPAAATRYANGGSPSST